MKKKLFKKKEHQASDKNHSSPEAKKKKIYN